MEPQFDRDWFTYRGREWRIFKRGKGARAKWYLYFEHKGDRIKHSLGETAKETAIATAKIKIDAVLDGHKAVLRASMHKPSAPAALEFCTIAKLIEAYEDPAKVTLDISATTRRANVNCFKNVLTKVCGDVAALTSQVLNADTARDWFDKAILAAQAKKGQEDQARVKRSANSVFNQAKSLLRPKCVAAYQRAGLVLPDITPFLRAYKEEKFEGVTAVYDPPSEKIIRRTLHDWLKLPRNEFIAAGLMLACGLRKAEVQQVVWGMWTTSNKTPLLDGRGWVKNASGRFVVPPIDPFWKLLNRQIDREGWRGQADEPVLVGSKTDTEDNIFRNVGAWLRGLGWKTQKTNHALRAYSGSLVAMKFEIYRASAWLRHSSVEVTEQHYTHFLNERVFRPEQVRIGWAKSGTFSARK